MKNLAISLIAALAAGIVAAQTAAPATPVAAPAAAATATPAPATKDMADAEIRKIDKDARKITLKHGEIKNLDMPGMTMLFQVKDPAMLDMVKAGDKVKFKAEKIGGAIVVTEIQVTK